jgi:tripartite-type tricarboxylate transporter receptor subunit TctC
MALSRYAVGMLPVCLMLSAAPIVHAQDYPSRVIRFVTLSAGGGSDLQGRIIAPLISGPLGQPVIVDNRATGNAASEAAAKAPADGYTLLINGSSFFIAPLLQKTPYDVARDFTPVSLISKEFNVLVTHPALPVRSVKELIALARARPGDLNYATGTAGGLPHLAMELFNSMARVKIVSVFYKTTPQRMSALIAGESQLMISSNAALLAEHGKAGRMRLLAVANPETLEVLLPGVPTIASAGLPGYEATGLTVVYAPAKTPDPIINRLNQEISRALSQPEVKDKFLHNLGMLPAGGAPSVLAATVKADIARWSKVIKEANIKLE